VPSPDDGILHEAWLSRSDDEWAYEAWDAMLVALSAGTSPLEEAERLVQVDLQLLDHVDLQRWLSRPGTRSRADEAAPTLSVVLAYLCARGALPVPSVLDSFVYSHWADVTARTLFRALVLDSDVRVMNVAPGGSSTLLTAGLRLASMCVFDDTNLPALFVGLGRLQSASNNGEVPPEQQVEVTGLLDTVTRSPNFLAAVFRILARHHCHLALEDKVTGDLPGIDVLEQAASLLLPLIRKSSQTPLTLHVLMEQLAHDEGEPWSHALKMFIISVRLQATEKTGIACSSLLLDNLASKALSDKQVAGLVSEYVNIMPTIGVQKVRSRSPRKCVRAHVLCPQFVDIGARDLASRLTMILKDEHEYDKAGDVLQLLTSLVSSLRSRELNPPSVPTSVQDELVKEIHCVLTSFADNVRSHDSTEPLQDALTERIIFVARILQFDLGLSEIWTPVTCSIASGLCTQLFHLIIVCLSV
jgi:hypothetical protein